MLLVMGFFGGPHVLDALIGGVLAPDRPARPEDISDFMNRSTCDGLLMKICLGAMTMPVEGRAGPRLTRAFLRFDATERRRIARTKPAPEIPPKPGDGVA